MSFISKPKVLHTKLPKNELNLTVREYELAALPQAPTQDAWASLRSEQESADRQLAASASQPLHSFQ